MSSAFIHMSAVHPTVAIACGGWGGRRQTAPVSRSCANHNPSHVSRERQPLNGGSFNSMRSRNDTEYPEICRISLRMSIVVTTYFAANTVRGVLGSGLSIIIRAPHALAGRHWEPDCGNLSTHSFPSHIREIVCRSLPAGSRAGLGSLGWDSGGGVWGRTTCRCRGRLGNGVGFCGANSVLCAHFLRRGASWG